MKKTTIIFSLCALMGCALLAGCSKPKDVKTQPENNPTPSSASSPASAVSADSADMRVKWTVGRKFMMRMELAQTFQMDLPNQPQQMEQKVNLDQDFDIASLNELGNGGRQLELEFKGQTIDVSQGGLSVLSFDSAKSSLQDTNPIVPLLKKMIGAKVRYFTDAEGKVEKVEGVEELMNRIGFNRKSQQHALFKQMFSEETLRQYGSFGDIMPNRTVKIGESWSAKKETPTGAGNIVMDMKYTFKSWEQQGNHKCARIKMEGDISAAPGSSPSPGPAKIEKGKMSGDIWFDPELGMIVSEKFDQTMTLKIVAGAQTMMGDMKQTIRMTLVDVKTAR